MPIWKIVKSPLWQPATATRCRSSTNTSNHLSALTWPSCRYALHILLLTIACFISLLWNWITNITNSAWPIMSLITHLKDPIHYCYFVLFAGNSIEQQRLQLCPVPARDCFWAVIWGNLCGYWGEVDDWTLSMLGSAVHFASSRLLWLRTNQQGRPGLCRSECSWVSQDNDQEVRVSLSRDINATCWLPCSEYGYTTLLNMILSL